MDGLWLILLGSAALLARAGQVCLAAGHVRARHSAAAVTRSLLDLAVVAVAFWLIGGAFVFRPAEAIVAPSLAHFAGAGVPSAPLFMLLAMVALGSGGACLATAERGRAPAALLVSLLLAGVICPILLHWTRVGWLAGMGLQDLAGAAGVQVPCGVAALVAASATGARRGKFNRDGSTSLIPGHSVNLAAIGVALLLAGWIALLAGGSALLDRLNDRVAINVVLAAAGGTLSAAALSRARFGKVDCGLLQSGIIAALAAISAGAGALPGGAALVVGLGAGALCMLVAELVELRLRVDETSGAFAANAGGAAWGVVATAALLGGPHADRAGQVLAAALAVAVAAALAGAVTWAALKALACLIPLRVSEGDEFDGLDLADHDVNAYPDFQQNTIRSYHLREA